MIVDPVDFALFDESPRVLEGKRRKQLAPEFETLIFCGVIVLLGMLVQLLNPGSPWIL